MPEKESIGHQRVMLLKKFMDRNISYQLQDEMFEIIIPIRDQEGQVQADNKAKQLIELINSCKTEQEIWDKLETLK